MNTSFLGSRSSCAANQCWRCPKTSERCCSWACADFFKCDPVEIEEAPDRGRRETLAAIDDQALLDFQQRHIRLATNEAQQIIAVRLDAAGAASAQFRGNLARGSEALQPACGAGKADPPNAWPPRCATCRPAPPPRQP